MFMTIQHVNTLPLAAPRFTGAEFPPYRFVPGRHPHPIAHPDGHSYRRPGSAEPPISYVPPQQWRESPDYLFGCDLYNHGYWWEAHEAWEGLWRVVPLESAQRRFLQGLIQIAAIHLQLFQGHPDGVARLQLTSAEHLSAADRLRRTEHTLAGITAPQTFMGVDISELQRRIDVYCELTLRDSDTRRPPWHEPAAFPYILPND